MKTALMAIVVGVVIAAVHPLLAALPIDSRRWDQLLRSISYVQVPGATLAVLLHGGRNYEVAKGLVWLCNAVVYCAGALGVKVLCRVIRG